MRAAWVALALAAGCGKDDPVTGKDQGPKAVPWSGGLPASGEVWSTVEGFQPRRSVIHLHSPWSHDACDGAGLEPVEDPSGAPNAACLADLREGLCTTHMDVAFVTDHPAYAAYQDWDRLLLNQPGDELLTSGADTVGVRIPCDDGHQVTWLPGYEDDLMPVALDRHVPGTADERLNLLNGGDAATIAALHDTGGTVLAAHTEGRDLAWLQARHAEGLDGFEMFNLHAMFAPDIREEDLGLLPFGWAEGVETFTTPEGGGEPDLLFLAVLQHQPPSLAAFDAVRANGPVTGTGGTDAHQNVLNYDLPDAERGDSYRRMLRWFSNVLLTEGDEPSDVQAALEAGRNYVIFEALGTPVDFGVWFEQGGQRLAVGADVTGPGTLDVGCPSLAASAPRGELDPEIQVAVLKDGAVWKTSCGRHEVTDPGVYRVQVEVTPHHLEPFLGTDPSVWIRSYPWIYSNAFRVL